ncbi:MAG TPA: GntR family transcriptional regulator [Pseudonocardiaceae bacterium]|nr:GntR family transcriptional regulator [Pseudonocardiaceae bacterium]
MAQRSAQPGMRISVNRDVAIPLVNQIHDQIVAAIDSGDVKPGDRLPTIRELAQFLKINRNTVGQAYRLLETSGHVYTRAGGGTTVSGPAPTSVPTRQHELRSLVTSALKHATKLGFTAAEFGQLAYYEGQRWAQLPRVTVLVVHDYPGELELLCAALGEESAAVDAKGVLLADLTGHVEDVLAGIGEIDFALVPVRLLERAISLLAGAPFPVLGAGIGPSLATLVQVAKETSGQARRVAVVCSDPAGAAMMEEVLRSADVVMADVRQVTASDPALPEAVAWADLLLVSDASADAVAGIATGKQLIRFATLISDSSLATVRSYIEHLIQRKYQAESAN